MSKSTLEYLQSPQSIRERCGLIYNLALQGGTHFQLHPERLQATADFVAEIISQQYPEWKIPHHSRWRHFDASASRMKLLSSLYNEKKFSPLEKLKSKWDLAIVSVLLDAGAGAHWSYRDQEKTWIRSEGLAMASFDMFIEGAFSSRPSTHPLQVDAQGLLSLTAQKLKKGFQIEDNNPLVGWEGRLALLQSLGKVLETSTLDRPGNLIGDAIPKNISAEELLTAVLKNFGPIWPGRLSLEGVSLGDVWNYPPLQTFIPFHKLSQWLTYSLLEPLEEMGTQVTGLEDLTGLAEYRNGGLFLDSSVITLREPALALKAHAPDSELIIEWRALTVVLLDQLALLIRNKVSKSAQELPLSRILEGGTWLAGRRLAQKAREDGGPPLKITSDGTVF